MMTEFPLHWLPTLGARFIFYLRAQYWDTATLRSYADERLRRLIQHAGQHVPYYRELFRAIGFDPATFHGREDLARLPLLDKETVRSRWKDMIADNAEAFCPTGFQTSGSTGTPLRFLLSAACRINDAAATLRGYQWAGFLPGMKVFTLRSVMHDWEFSYNMMGRSLNASAVKLSRESAPRYWREINRLKPSFFHGHPFPLIMLAQLAQESGLSYHRPKTIISVGESLPMSLRRRLADSYGGARIFDFYSMMENAVLIAECPHGTKHVNDDYACHEFVDERGNRVASGTGELVGTSYYNYAMPLIRYRTRDYARLPTRPTACPCGRSFRAVQFIEGRKEDYIQTPEGRFINLFEEPMNAGQGIAASQYVQDALDHMYVNILPAADFDPSSLGEVERELRLRVGQTIRIEFKVVDQMERRSGESGKIPFLISKIGNTTYTVGDFTEVE